MNISPITVKVSSFANIISIAFMYFSIKDLCGEEEENEAFNKFLVIEAVYIVVAFVVRYLGIYI